MPELGEIRILIADDHRMFRQGLRRLLQTEPDLAVVGEATDGEEAVRLARELKPDILLLDVAMPRVSGLEALRRLSGSKTMIMLLTASVERDQILQALGLGIRGVVLKHVGAEVLLKSIRAVMAGEYWLERDVLTQWALAEKPPETRTTLTARELEIVREILAGSTNRHIASRLRISEETVKRHLSNIYDKLGLSNRLELVLYALHHRLVPPS